MCNYQLIETTPNRRCQIGKYFSQIKKEDLPPKSIFHKKILPIDANGLCIFHSPDVDWKLQNRFDLWIEVLVNYLRHLDKVMYMLTDPPSLKLVDLTGVYLIGKEKKLKGGSTETTLKIRSLELKDQIEISLDYAKIVDPFYFEGCKMEKADVSFNNTIVDAELYLTNTDLGKLTFNNCSLNGGLLMNNCDLSGYAEFGGMKAKNVFQLSHVNFETNAFFNNSLFNCESVFMEQLHFLGKADFSECTFFGDVEIQECHFEQLLNFTNAAFNGPLSMTGNCYDDNVYFISNEKQNKIFNDNVNFLFIDKDNEVQERIIFDNVNYYYIGRKDRDELAELARLNKVTIGSGCIKYRLQTPPILIKTNDISVNIAKELANSFTNYFTSSTGSNLGVEFIDNRIHSVKLFYFTDEDITEADFFERLKLAQAHYWRFVIPDVGIMEKKEIAREIDSQVSKIAIALKIGMLNRQGLMQEEEIVSVLDAIDFGGADDMVRDVKIIINQYNNSTMNIGKVIAEANSQVNIADVIKHIEFNPQPHSYSKEDFEKVKHLLVKLDDSEIGQLQSEVANTDGKNVSKTVKERSQIMLNDFALKHGVPILDGIASSVLFEILKAFFQ